MYLCLFLEKRVPTHLLTRKDGCMLEEYFPEDRVHLRFSSGSPLSHLGSSCFWAYGVVVSIFDFHCSDRGSNPGRGGKIS